MINCCDFACPGYLGCTWTRLDDIMFQPRSDLGLHRWFHPFLLICAKRRHDDFTRTLEIRTNAVLHLFRLHVAPVLDMVPVGVVTHFDFVGR